MVLNKYSEVTIDKKNYKVFNGLPNQNVLLKTYWNEVKVLTENHELIETLPRPYTFKPQEIKWLDVFRNYVAKPRTYQYSQFKKMLPECINTYLTEDLSLQKERLKAIYHWLGNYELNQICEVISLRVGQETPYILSQRLAVLHGCAQRPPIIDDPYTPENLQNQTQDLSVYDALMKKGGHKACQ